MASFQKRIVDKWLADKLEAELEAYRDPDLQGVGTVFASLTHWLHLHPNDMKKVEKQMESEIKRLKRSANLPERWRDVRAALTGEAPEPNENT